MSLLPIGAIPHLLDPCDRCGYPTRYKQYPVVCRCTTPDRCPHPPTWLIGGFCRRCGGHLANKRGWPARELQTHIDEIQAQQDERTAALRKIDHRHIPPLRVTQRYAAGRPRVAPKHQVG
jgi:hypothetical protein